jgi:hypothetical protein
MLDLLQKQKRIINVDESWLGETDFRRKMWGPKDQTNSLRERTISPRVTLIIAYDNNGMVHLSFSQSNTDAHFF